MEVMKARRVSAGEVYTPLFPPATGIDRTVKKSADLQDTVRLIKKVVSETLWHTEKIAPLLKGNNLKDTCDNIWHFVYKHVDYKKDEDGIEQIRSPRRTWHDRAKGVDCDCYTVFISSILTNLNIPHRYRITKYPKKPPELPSWQHIYIVVPKNGRLNGELENENEYITLDCVKDGFDSEEWYLQKKDYTAMKLDYLDGLDSTETEYVIPPNQDAQDLAAIYDEEVLGELGSWLKKAVKNVAKVAVKPITQPLKVTANLIKNPGKVIKNIPKDLKKGVAQAKQAVHVINKVTNPGAILLRNGFLVAMKLNLFNIAKRLRYAYLSDEKALAMGIDLNKLQDLRKVREKAENIYWTAGGEKSNLAKAIVKGKGNKDGKVSLAGFNDEVYADPDEYQIVHASNVQGLGELGEVATAASIAAATGFLTALATALKSITGLFKGNPKEEQNFQSEEGEGKVEDLTKDYSQVSEEEIAEAEFPQEAPAQEPQANTYVAPPAYTLPVNLPATSNNSSSLPVMDRAQEGNMPSTANNDTQVLPPQSGQSLLPIPATPSQEEPWMKKNSKMLIGVGAGLLILGGIAWKLNQKDKKGNTQRANLNGTNSNKTNKKNRIEVVKIY